MAAQSGTQATGAAPSKDQAFFSEESTRHILTRIANVFDDTDLCDATFVVGDAAEKEEIMAPSQFMAMSSSYFKELFYPPREDKTREIAGMQPKIFRKILDYLFRGRVPLSSIEDAWKVKVAGRTFELKELEELCTKFLKYRIDSKNLVHFLKNTTRYNTPDLKEVVISRFVKDASTGFENDQVLDLSEEELLCIMERKPEVQGKKVMDVFIRWARKINAAKKKVEEQAKAAEKKTEEESKAAEKKAEEEKAAELKGSEKEDEAKTDVPSEKTKETSEKEDKEENKIDQDEKAKEANDKKEEDKTEVEQPKKVEDEKMDTEENKEPESSKEEETNTREEEENLIDQIEKLVKHITWDSNDAEYYLKDIHTKKILSENNKNIAMAQMLKSFVDLPVPVQQSQTPAKLGPKSVQQQRASPQRATPQNRNQRGGPASQKRPAGECDVVMERISKNPRASANNRVKTEDEIL